MPKHIEGIPEAAAEDMDGVSNTPTANHLFQVREDGGTLAPVQADLFQTIMEKILFISCQSRPDLKRALDFLTTRVRNPEEVNYRKLDCKIQYIRGTQVMELTLEVE